MKKEFNEEQAKQDLLFLLLKLFKADNEIREAYSKIKEIYEGI